MELPEELLQRIVECIAYDTGFVERHLPTYHWKYSTTPLLSLSMANHQLRRICFPFLFSCVEVELEDLNRFTDLCSSSQACALSIRALNLQKTSRELREPPTETIECLLNYLKNLLQLNLPSIWIDMPLLALINRHPVPTVNAPGTYFYDVELLSPGDLSKFVFDHASVSDESGRNELEPFIACGAQVRQLHLFRANLLEESIGVWQLHGLCELRLNLDQHAATFSWIPDFAYANFHLRKISFTTSFSRTTNVLRDPSIPFVNSFVEKACQAGLDNDWTIKGFSVTRRRRAGSTAPAPGDMSEWYVSGLNLNFREWSSGRLLQIAHSSFPQISVLSFDDLSAPFEELVTALGRFSSLRVVNFGRPLSLLYYGIQMPDSVAIKELDAGMIRYTSRIAERLRTIEAFYILGLQCDDQPWYLYGWLNVHYTRHTVGPLRVFYRQLRSHNYSKPRDNFQLLI